MRTTVEPLEGNKVKLSIEVDEDEFAQAVDVTLRKIARDVRLPGFRPGKAPRQLVAARMGKDGVRQETLREALPEYYTQALRETAVDAIAPPEIEITGGEADGPLAFDAVVEVRPRLALAGYQGLGVTIPAAAVSDEELARQVDRLRQPFGELKMVDRPAIDGDHVTISLHGTRDGEEVAGLSADDYLYEVGSAGIVEELDDNLRRAKVGDILAFDATVGEDTVSFKVIVKEVKEMILPPVTDEWASEASEFETVDELRDDLRRRMGEVKKLQANLALQGEAIKALVELVVDEPPDPLINQEVERRVHDIAHRLEAQGVDFGQYLAATGQSSDEFLEGIRGTATDAVKADLALRAVADGEALEVVEDDLDEELERLAANTKATAARLRTQLDLAGQLPAVRSDIRKTKALGWLLDHVEIVDEAGNNIDRADLAPTPDAPAPDETDETEEEG